MSEFTGTPRNSDRDFRLNLDKVLGKSVVDGVDISFLIEIVKNPRSRADLRLKGIDTLRCLCQCDEYKKALASKELGILSTLFDLLQKKAFPVNKVLECLQSLAKTNPTSAVSMSSPDTDFLESLIDEIRLKKAESEEVRICCSLLCTLVVYKKDSVRDLIDHFLHVDALNFIEASGPDPNKWNGCNSAEGWSTYVLMLCAAQPEISAEALIETGVVQVISPVAQHDGLLAMMASMALAFLSFTGCDTGEVPETAVGVESEQGGGSEKVKESTKKNTDFATPDVITKVLDIFDNTVHRRGGKGYSDSTFMLSLVMRAIRCLVYAGKFPSTEESTHTIITLMMEVINAFITDEKVGNEPNEEGVAECVEIALEMLHHYFLTEPAIHSAAPKKSLKLPNGKDSKDKEQALSLSISSIVAKTGYTPEPYMIELLPQLQASVAKMRFCTRSELVEGKRPQRFINDILNGKRDAKTPRSRVTRITDDEKFVIKTPRSSLCVQDIPAKERKIVVSRFLDKNLSACYHAERFFVDGLRRLGYANIYSENAPEVLKPLKKGAPLPRSGILNAMDAADTVIIFISPIYLRSASCHMEELYAWSKYKQEMVQLVYIAMDDLTGRKLPGCEDPVIDSYRKVILSRQEIIVLYEEEHVQRAYELVIEALGDSEQLKLGRALSNGDFDFVAATSPDVEIPIECLPIADSSEGSSSVAPKAKKEEAGESGEGGKEGKDKEAVEGKEGEAANEEISWQTVFTYRINALQAELEQQQQAMAALSSAEGGGASGGNSSNATLNRRHRMDNSSSWTPSSTSGMLSGAETPVNNLSNRSLVSASGNTLSNRSLVSTPVLSRSGSPSGQAALLMRTSAAALGSGPGAGGGSGSGGRGDGSSPMSASRSGADTPNGSNRSWVQFFAGGK